MNFKYCSNCGAVVTGKFCGQCGMKLNKKPVNIQSLVSPVIEKITHWERKVFLTVKYLFIEPDRVPKEFIQGDRRKFYHPVKFLMYWAGISILISILLGNGMGNLVLEAGNYNPVYDKLAQNTQDIITKYYALMWVFCIPFLSLAPFFVFRNSELKFVYHNVILCYIVGVNLILGIPSMILVALWKSSEPVIDIVWIVLPFLYCFYMYHSYFKQKIWKSILCSILSFLFIVVGYGILFALIFIVLCLIELSKGTSF